jgi:hypothetical protein
MRLALQGAGTNYTALVKPLQWLVIAVIFLLFLRVARAVTVQGKSSRGVSAPNEQRRRSRRFALEFIEPSQRFGERVELPEHLDIGRLPTSGLVLDDAFVSGRHARVEYVADGLVLADVGSTNGTFVNEKVIAEPTMLRRGDVVQIGGFVFEVVR